jgi:hypothetical protein
MANLDPPKKPSSRRKGKGENKKDLSTLESEK